MNLSSAARGRLTIAASFAAALLLAIVPGPDWAEPFRPEWVGLVLIYWCMATPQRVGVGVGWSVGLMLDVLYGSLLGQHALAKALIAYLTVRFHTQLRMFPRWQQAASVLVLVAINHLLVLWAKALASEAPVGWSYWTPSVVSMLVWPWLFVILRDIRRRAKLA
ncbi:MAG: rod shape-determining protein MreD [Candidatus Muproteobacteria bacterium RBG_16_64_11]|uniref:Rod shape-determining protein MreD n=1 Tax=Candidatus Muproteobacteria bacterium RBG_16_64_11 TaxID=1817758 RepID=A0A1F6THX6_9PROT|nr:MAG: rod shape-determining protein MreD [Candidatus Muproteobacteria bacterium RBG_16_64_11]